jgi:putative flavoprotein involved in K+ transport
MAAVEEDTMMSMHDVDTVVIGAGQAGLAVSQYLTRQGREHVVLDRGRVASRWHTERWDSLRLLTPNWMNTLPGWSYAVSDPDGYLTATELADLLTAYAASFGAPVHEGEAVTAVEAVDGGSVVTTASGGSWRAVSVVVATGAFDLPAVPVLAGGLSPDVTQVTTSTYRRPGDLPAGGVLVVGASASGVQIADELAGDGRHVVLAVGRHTRLPRRYRGMDVMWWLQAVGALDRNVDEFPDRAAAVREPSLQLVGRTDGRNLDLEVLHRRGVVLAGRLTAAEGTRARFADDLATTTAQAERQLRRTLGRIDAHVLEHRLGAELLEPQPLPEFIPPRSPAGLDLAAEGITSVVWATGHRRAYPWLRVPVLDADGEIRQRAGITDVPGLYTVGQRFQTRRNSTFIGGVGHDAALVAAHIDALRPRRRRSVLAGSRP